ncbi:hypothetical protein RISINGSUN_15 [Erwinia phage vB_EamM_RisingSun]|uniref:Uncharacterized protein n=1 Tax=Erwinia phage vB_EamM_RisingSun TaxID=2026080 RepID=A0A223LI60_9CAUD|nr:hypothetical protein FDI45_gp015 [Erwinia phage vB_EamM_RisingSun]ASU03655.1 hypothetical protein RISINGSUN_15 [Erwinia phage vB_EamM_RisingSun]
MMITKILFEVLAVDIQLQSEPETFRSQTTQVIILRIRYTYKKINKNKNESATEKVISTLKSSNNNIYPK